jgi:hypothetical protein
MISRRGFFTGLLGVASSMLGLTACEEEEDRSASASGNEQPIHRRTLDAIVDVYVPADEDPGALQAGVPVALIERLDKSDSLKQQVLALIASAERAAWRRYKHPFYRLSLEQRTSIIDTIRNNRRNEDKVARLAAVVLHGQVIDLFYTSPQAWAMLGYTAPYPGGYPDYDASPFA